jgi:hypothetical protein
VLVETSKPTSQNLNKKDRDNKNYSIMLSSRSNKWKEKLLEPQVKDLKKRQRDYREK